MEFHIFESGSKGNCTLIISNNHHILIDDGISRKKLVNYLSQYNLTLDDIEALLVTHDHGDHISGIEKAFPTHEKIYTTKLVNLDIPVENLIEPYNDYFIAGFKITCLPTSHDAPGSIGFILEDEEEKLVYITDTGYLFERVVDLINNADYYIIESNHNVRMEINSKRSASLIKRVLGDEGHLSNVDSANYMCDVIGSRTKQIILAHLSEDANTPEQALLDYQEEFEKRDVDFSNYDIRCASQHEIVSGGNLKK